MGKVVRRSQKERNLAIKIVSDGGSFEDAAKETGYGVDYVRQLCAKAKVYSPKTIDPNKEKQAVELLKSGVTVENIANILGYTESGVFGVAKRHNINCITETGIKREKLTKDILQFRNSGYSMKEISNSLNITLGTVRYTCKKIGIGGNLVSGTINNKYKEKRICLNCGKEFECDKRSNQKFCSVICQRYYHHVKNDVVRKRLINKQKIENITLKDVARKDNNICYLCGKKLTGPVISM